MFFEIILMIFLYCGLSVFMASGEMFLNGEALTRKAIITKTKEVAVIMALVFGVVLLAMKGGIL